jgi:hypothetical protein
MIKGKRTSNPRGKLKLREAGKRERTPNSEKKKVKCNKTSREFNEM